MDVKSCATPTVLEHHEKVSSMKNNSMEVELNIEINNDKSDIKNDNNDDDNNCNDKSMPKECKNLIDEQENNIENIEGQEKINEKKEDSKEILGNSKETKEEKEKEEITTTVVLDNSGQSDLKTSYSQESELENISTEENEISQEKVGIEFDSNKSLLSKDNSDEIYNEKQQQPDDNTEEVEDLSMEEEDEEENEEEDYGREPGTDNEIGHENIVDDEDDDDDDDEDEDDEDDDDDDEVEDDDEESEEAADVEDNENESNVKEDDVELIISSDEEEEQMNNQQEISKMKNIVESYQHNNFYDDEDDSDDDNEVYDDDNENLMNEVFMFSKNEPKSIRNEQNLVKKKEDKIQKNNWNFIIKEKKKSIKLLNNRKWLKKSNDYISGNNRNFSPLPSVSKLYDVQTIKDDHNDYDMNEKLSGHQYHHQQQQQQKQRLDNSGTSNNKPLISIEIEDSPEKESFNSNNMKQTVKEEKKIIQSSKIAMSFENEKSQIKNLNEKNHESFNMNETRNESIKQEKTDENIEIIINVNDDDINMKNLEENKTKDDQDKDENNILENQSKINNDCQQEEKNNDKDLEICEVIEGSKEGNKEKGKSESNRKESEKDVQEQSIIINTMDKDNNEKKALPSHVQDSQLSGDSIPEINLKRTRKNSFNQDDKHKLDEKNDEIHENELHPTKKLKSELQSNSNSATLKLNQQEINEDDETQLPTINESRTELQSNSPTTSKLNQNKNNENHNDNNNELHSIKKLRSELQSNFPIHNKILNDYIEKITNNSVNEIQKHLQQTINEIQTLNDMIRQNEIEWENMLHLKKIKEEICYRLTRKKHQIEIISSKYEEIYENSETLAGSNTIIDDGSTIGHNYSNNYNKQQQQQQQQEKETINNNNNNNNKITNNSLHMVTSTPNNTANDDNLNMIEEGLLKKLKAGHMLNANSDKSINSENLNILNSSIGITKSILQSRANMKSSDLVKEKSNLQKFHRLLVSRNILPKPSSSALIFGSRPTIDSNTLSTTTSISTPSHSVPLSTYTQQTPEGNSITITTTSGNGNLQQQFENNRKSINQQQQQHNILNTYLTETANVQQQVDEMLNGYFNSQINRQYNQQQQQQQQQQQYQQQNYITTSNSNQQPVMIGRQGVFKDVKSIIADYRQKHPEVIPRRGRRLKGTNNNNNALNQAFATEVNSILGNALKTEFGGNSRPSSNDSSHSINHVHGANINNTNLENLQIKDFMAQFAKISGQNVTAIERGIKSLQSTSGNNNNPIQSIVTTPPYPEVTLHPVTTSQSNNNENQTGSLLHGILTKYGRSSAPTVTVSASPSANINNNQGSSSSYKSSFSPTLARLLTAPERITSINSNSSAPISSSIAGNLNSTGAANNTTSSATAAAIAAAAGLNFSKVVSQNSEITITPVTSSSQSTLHQTLLQQQQQQQQQKQHAEFIQHKQHLQELLSKGRNLSVLDDDADDSVDRLVIDEGGNNSGAADECHRIAPHAIGQEFHENEVPVCQGCKKQEAQFVCAGCGNQWYCSRECQVNAWDEHSEVCTG